MLAFAVKSELIPKSESESYGSQKPIDYAALLLGKVVSVGSGQEFNPSQHLIL